ncbi:MAG: PEP-CTERM sorting domain-containing protein [Sedimentisphaerales bacterium]|nr:PEP-CTERM sorting domain-containing protein [Sedimentisphaerales bacterium]MBN2843899.1 PEP-CTERM sorting domain-containing protein [Sedimentisphaerales bacterium]
MRTFLASALAMLLSSVASANYMLSGENHTYQLWDFNTDPGTIVNGVTYTIAPEVDENGFGDPVAYITGVHGSTVGSNPFEWANVNGITYWTAHELDVSLYLPNSENTIGYTKDLVVSFRFRDIMVNEYFDYPQGFSDDPALMVDMGLLSVTSQGTAFEMANIENWSIVKDTHDLSYNWYIFTGWFTMSPNPTEEILDISISGTGGYLDWVSVETQCVPEPATILFSVGGLLAFSRRRG